MLHNDYTEHTSMYLASVWLFGFFSPCKAWTRTLPPPLCPPITCPLLLKRTQMHLTTWKRYFYFIFFQFYWNLNIILLFFKDFTYSWETEREAEAEGEADSMQGAWYGTQSQDHGIMPRAEGRCSTAEPPRSPDYIPYAMPFIAVTYLFCNWKPPSSLHPFCP